MTDETAMTTSPLRDIVDTEQHPISDDRYREECRRALADAGALVLRGFLRPRAVAAILREAEDQQHLAFYSTQTHNAYLEPPDPTYHADHPRNRSIVSSKGCITDDLVAPDSALRRLHEAPEFREFLCVVLGESALHGYADPLSSINLHYFRPGQELGWHFDNSAFAITLMIQPPERGGAFEYVGAARDTGRREDGYPRVAEVLDGAVQPVELAMDAGGLALFRGRDALHRVAPVAGARTRILAVLAYNTRPGVALSESAQRTFYGRHAPAPDSPRPPE